MDTEIMFARAEHGGHRVVRANRDIQIEWPQGAQVYGTARGAIIALYSGRPKPPSNAYAPHLCFDRYFRRGRYQRRPPPPAIDVLEMFRPDPPNQVSITRPETPISKTPLTVHVPALGIDLSKRAIEVRKIFFAGFARKIGQMGYDPEDVLQEVYHGILVRNKGKCPFDVNKSSFAHYVHMVVGCLLSNYRRRYSRLERNEQFGVFDVEGKEVDVALGNLALVEPTQDSICGFSLFSDLLEQAVIEAASQEGIDTQLAVQCLWMLAEGFLYREIAEKAGCKISEVSTIVRMIRRLRSKVGSGVQDLLGDQPI